MGSCQFPGKGLPLPRVPVSSPGNLQTTRLMLVVPFIVNDIPNATNFYTCQNALLKEMLKSLKPKKRHELIWRM